MNTPRRFQHRYLRWGAWALAALITYFVFIQWQQHFGLDAPGDQSSPTEQASTGLLTGQQEQIGIAADSSPVFDSSLIPDDDPVSGLVSNSGLPGVAAKPQSYPQGRLIRVTSDLLELRIDLHGGDVVEVWLKDHPLRLDSPGLIQLLRRDVHTYIAQSGLVGSGPDAAADRPTYTAQGDTFTLAPGQEQLEVVLSHTHNGLRIQKIFRFKRDRYLIEVIHRVANQGDVRAELRQFGQIRRDDYAPQTYASSGLGVRPFVGAATTTADTKYEKINFKEMRNKDLRVEVEGGWMAMIQHYFMSAWVGNAKDSNLYLTREVGKDQFIVGFLGPRVSLPPGQSSEFTSGLYIGPKIIKRLEEIAPNLDLTVDFGWLWFIAVPLFYLLNAIHSFVGNWGVAIILLTMLIKLVFFYPSQLSYRSMAKMRKLGPQMKQLRETYSSDKSKLQQEMMGLYKRERVNPLGGCLPILIQMPVFIALYWMLRESVELRHAPFILWMHDLTAIDPYFVLPLLMGATMFIQQLLSPAPPDPTQAKIMRMLPVVFTFMFLWFPSGLVLYWVTNNTLSILQQWVITRSIK